MQNMIQSSLLQLRTVNFPAGFCAAPSAEPPVTADSYFAGELFKKDEHPGKARGQLPSGGSGGTQRLSSRV